MALHIFSGKLDNIWGYMKRCGGDFSRRWKGDNGGNVVIKVEGTDS